MRLLWFGIMTRELLLGYCAFLLSLSVTCRNARGKVWGTDEINVEGWKPLKRLQGHSSGSCAQSRLNHVVSMLFSQMSPTLHGHQETDTLPQSVSTRQLWFGVALHLVYLSYLLSIFLHSLTHLDQNVYASLTYTKASSRVCAGTLSENSLPLSRMIGVSRYGKHLIGRLKQK